MSPTITEHVLRGASDYPDRPAIVGYETGSVLTFGELAARIARARTTLVAAGIRPGQTVALIAPTSAVYVVAYQAIASAGAIVTPMNPSYTTYELSHQLLDSEAVLLVCPAQYGDTALEAIEDTKVERIMALEALLSSTGPIAPAVGDQGGPAVLPYSSGTTGLPKGVMLGHSNLVAQLEALASGDPLEPGHVALAVVPFFHILGMQLIMNNTLAQGATIVTMPRFDLVGSLEAIAHHRVTRVYAVPPILAALAQYPAVCEYDLSSLVDIITGAAPVSAHLLATGAATLGCVIREGFGMTELAGASHMATGRSGEPEGCGYPFPGIECRIVDESGRPLAPGAEGELWIRSTQVMQGYWRNPEATAATIVDGGWLRTGDVGRISPDGRLAIVDRLKELIKCSGFQVAPAELEGVLATHPAVADAAVIGIPDDARGEVPKALVVRKAGQDVSAEEVMAYVNERLARYKHVHHLEFVEAVPRTPSGKILRRALRG